MPEERPHLRIVPSEQDSIEVVELGSGERVYRPDIAAKALGVFGDAIEAAGGELVIPDDISEIYPDPTAPIE